jgi:hypothetical protein
LLCQQKKSPNFAFTVACIRTRPNVESRNRRIAASIRALRQAQ